VLGGARRFGAHRRRVEAGHIVAAARLQLVNQEVMNGFYQLVETVFRRVRTELASSDAGDRDDDSTSDREVEQGFGLD